MVGYQLLIFAVFLLGLIGLSLSAELLVRGASKMATSLGVSHFVVGATVVAYGTSMPEMLVSTIASYQNVAGIAVGNVVGSNLMNTGLVLGIAAMITPIFIDRGLFADLVRKEIPLHFIVTFVVLGMVIDGLISRWEGLALVLLLSAYIVQSVRSEIKRNKDVIAEDEKAKEPVTAKAMVIDGLGVLVGLGGLMISARYMVDSAVVIAHINGVGERIIGLTIVAMGTSLPELAASVAAALRKETDILLGGLVGSNLFNLGLILGSAALIRPVRVVADGKWLDFGFLGLNAVMVTLFMITGKKIARGEGIALLVTYFIFFAALFVRVAP